MTDKAKPNSPAGLPVAKIISFVALLAIVALFGALFFRVMAFFLLPAFLAVILVVIFRPLHLWMVTMCKGRIRVAAGLTTITILLIVLVPMLLFLANAAAEAWAFYKGDNRKQGAPDQPPQAAPPVEPRSKGLTSVLGKVRTRLGLELPPEDTQERLEHIVEDLADMRVDSEAGDKPSGLLGRAAALQPDVREVADWIEHSKANPRPEGKSLFPRPNKEKAADLAGSLKKKLARLAKVAPGDAEFEPALIEAETTALDLRRTLVGNTLEYWIREHANPDPDELDALQGTLRGYLAPAARNTGEVLLKFLIGLVVMIISLYYFLADGPAMLESVLALSPLDERYEKQLLTQFAKISRAVVLATLLSAVAQGVLAGIGFKLAGVQAVFLLAVLSTFLAMVPFVGAAAVWVPCAIWLFLDGHPLAGTFLAVYGVAVISMVDNLIKPLVLHGQSNLHPLLALLSVLGGVQALGPIGIFVGPMAVVFLQTVLQMLHTELKSLGAERLQVAGEAEGTGER